MPIEVDFECFVLVPLDDGDFMYQVAAVARPVPAGIARSPILKTEHLLSGHARNESPGQIRLFRENAIRGIGVPVAVQVGVRSRPGNRGLAAVRGKDQPGWL